MTEIKAKVLRGVGGLYGVMTPSGDEYTCRAKGTLKRDDNRVTVGDDVILSVGEGEGELVIREILPQKNRLIRPPIANIDVMLVVAAAKSPAPVLSTLDKMTAILAYNAIRPVMVFTKADLDMGAAERFTALYRRAGYDAFTVSSETGDGLSALSEYVKGALGEGASLAFAGASGVGKSTLLNVLFPSLSLATGGISTRIERGKHTTRTVELFPMDGGFIADTPGFSLLDFTRFDFFPLEALFTTFPDFLPYRGACRYADCTHTKEAECEVKLAAMRGDIAPSRHESYIEMYTAIKAKKPYKK